MEEQEALLGQHGSPKGKSSKHSLQLIPPSTLENKVYQGGGSDQDDRSKAKVPFDIAEAFSMHPEGGPTQVGPMHPPKKVPLTHYDQLLPFLGSFGLWQAMSVGILLLPALAAGMLLVLHNFSTLEPNVFRCRIPECDLASGAKFEDADPSLYLAKDKNWDENMKFCDRPVLLETSQLNSTSDFKGNCRAVEASDVASLEKCNVAEAGNPIVYKDFDFKRTIVTDFNLVCDRNYKATLCTTIYMIGLLFGSILGGPPADRYGRKPILFLSILLGGISTLSGGLVTTFWAYAFFRFFAGVAEQTLTQHGFTISVELVSANHVGIVGLVNLAAYGAGYLLLGGLAYFIRDWRNLHFATAGLIVPQIFLWHFVPESPRWLVIKQRWEDFQATIVKGFHLNGGSWPSHLVIPDKVSHVCPEHNVVHLLHQQQQSGEEVIKTSTLFTDGVLVSRLAILMISWGMSTLANYGMGLSSTVFGENIFISFSLVSAAEVLSNFVIIGVVDHWGRKSTMIFMFLVTVVGCTGLGILDTQPSRQWTEPVTMALMFFGKLGSSSVLTILYIYTAEVFPTSLRSSALGICSLSSRIFGVAAPTIATYLPSVTSGFQATFFTFAATGVLGALVTFIMPETTGFPLPDTLEETKALREHEKSVFSWWSTKRIQDHAEKAINSQKAKRALREAQATYQNACISHDSSAELVNKDA